MLLAAHSDTIQFFIYPFTVKPVRGGTFAKGEI
jgi:hypothetical protein